MRAWRGPTVRNSPTREKLHVVSLSLSFLMRSKSKQSQVAVDDPKKEDKFSPAERIPRLRLSECFLRLAFTRKALGTPAAHKCQYQLQDFEDW